MRDYTSGSPKLVLWQMEDASVMPYIISIIEAFEKENGGKIKVEQVHYSPEDIHHQYLTAAIAGAGPDLVLASGDKAGVFSIGKFILPVNEISGIDLKEFIKPALEAAKDDGRIWGLPVSTGNHLMLFHNLKLAPRAPKTTDEFLAMCREIKTKGPDVFCFATNIAEPFFFIPWLSSFGGWPIDGREPTLDTPEMRAALEFYKGLKDDHHIMPNECDYNCMDGLFKDGKAAFIMNGDWAIDVYRKKQGADFSIAVLPANSKTGKPMRPMVNGKYFMFNSNLDEDKLAWAVKFVRFFTNKHNQLEQFKELGRIPGVVSAFAESEKKASPNLRATFEELKIGLPAPMQVEMRAIWDAMRSQLGPYLGGRRDLETAVKNMQTESERKIKEMRIR